MMQAIGSVVVIAMLLLAGCKSPVTTCYPVETGITYQVGGMVFTNATLYMCGERNNMDILAA